MRRSPAVLALALVLAATLGTLIPASPVSAVSARQTSVVSADPADSTPHVLDGRVYGIAEVGSKVVVGGTFTQVRNQDSTVVLTRRSIFAYDKVSGRVDPFFVPVVDNVVNDVEAGPTDTVYLGGAFLNVNGRASRGLAKVNVADGSLVTGFTAPTNASVEDIVLRRNVLYVGGAFSTIRGVARARLAAVEPTTGVVNTELNLPISDPIAGSAGVKQLDVSPYASRLVVIGNFRKVNGIARSQVAVIDLAASPDRVANWETQRYTPRCSTASDTYVRGVDFSPDASYFVIVTTGASFVDTLCDAAARFETLATGTGLQPTWVDYTGGDTLLSVAVTDVAVYVGGHQRWLNNRNGAKDEKLDGAVDRSGVGALDPRTGVPLSWNPGRTRGVGAFVLVATVDGLYIGSDTTELGGEYHGRLGWFPLAGGTANAAPRPATLPTSLFVAAADGNLSIRNFDGAASGPATVISGPGIDGIDWTQVRGAFMANGRLVTIHADDTMKSWTWDGVRFVDPKNLNPWLGLATKSLLAYANGKVFYATAGDPRLFWRWFSIESGVLGSERFTADAGTGGAGWDHATGLTVASGKMYASHSNGNLTRTNTDARGLPVPGTTVTVSGPTVGDGQNWNVGDLFVYSG